MIETKDFKKEDCPKNCEDSNVKTSDIIKIKHLKIKNKLSKMKCIFLEWSHCVTYHCFPKIFKEKTHLILRLFWSLIFLSFASLTFFILAAFFRFTQSIFVLL